MQKLREETKKTRKFRKGIAKAHSSACGKFEMRPLRKFLTAARISYLRRIPFVLNRSHTTLVEYTGFNETYGSQTSPGIFEGRSQTSEIFTQDIVGEMHVLLIW